MISMTIWRVSLELCARDVELVAGFGDRDGVVWIGLAGGVGRDLFRWLCAVARGTICSEDHLANGESPHPHGKRGDCCKESVSRSVTSQGSLRLETPK